MRRYGNKRDAIEPEIVAALRQMGVVVYPTDKPFDSVLGYRGVTYLGEFKDPKKKGWKNEFTDDQKKFLETWRGSDVVVLRSIDDALQWVNSLN